MRAFVNDHDFAVKSRNAFIFLINLNGLSREQLGLTLRLQFTVDRLRNVTAFSV